MEVVGGGSMCAWCRRLSVNVWYISNGQAHWKQELKRHVKEQHQLLGT